MCVCLCVCRKVNKPETLRQKEKHTFPAYLRHSTTLSPTPPLISVSLPPTYSASPQLVAIVRMSQLLESATGALH